MATLLIGYDLNRPGKDYAPLIEHLKGYGAWWHHLDSTWLLKTTRTPVEVRDAVRTLIDTNDEVLVIDVTGRSAAWVGIDAAGSSWLKDNL